MELEKLKKSTIVRLKRVKVEQGLSISKIMDLLEEKGKFVSEATVKRVFSEGSEDFNFRYQDSIAPLADVLLDWYGDSSGLDDVSALKQIIHDKNQTIEFMMIKFEEQKSAYEKNVAHLKEQIQSLNERLDFRERVVDRKDAVIEKLLNAYLLKEMENVEV
jgi:DNA-binding transcriptional MerR regulator